MPRWQGSTTAIGRLIDRLTLRRLSRIAPLCQGEPIGYLNIEQQMLRAGQRIT